MKQSMRILMLGAAMMSLLASGVLADSFLRQANHTDGFKMMGQAQPEKNDTASLWMGEGKALVTNGDGTGMLLLAESEQMIVINHNQKTYSVMPMDFLSALMDEAADDDTAGEAMAMAQAMMGSMKVEVLPSEETAVISDWDCRKYDVTMSMGPMMSMSQETWATSEIELDYDMLNVLVSGMMTQMPGFEKVLSEMKKVKGMPVRTVTTMAAMGNEVKSTMDLLEYRTGDAPKDTYTIPEGYQEVEFENPMGMGRGKR